MDERAAALGAGCIVGGCGAEGGGCAGEGWVRTGRGQRGVGAALLRGGCGSAPIRGEGRSDVSKLADGGIAEPVQQAWQAWSVCTATAPPVGFVCTSQFTSLLYSRLVLDLVLM